MAKILLVEDDKSLREIYGVRLQAEGYEIVSAGDGEEALAMAIKERPDLIVSDVMMPKISGFDMLDILRSTTETKGVKVIMMTALSSDDQRARGEALGADKYLVKSQVGIEDVVRTVHEVLGDGAAGTAPAAAPAQDDTQAAPAPDPTTAASDTNTNDSVDSSATASLDPSDAATTPTQPLEQPAQSSPQPDQTSTSTDQPPDLSSLPPQPVDSPSSATDNQSSANPSPTQDADTPQPSYSAPSPSPESTPEPAAQTPEPTSQTPPVINMPPEVPASSAPQATSSPEQYNTEPAAAPAPQPEQSPAPTPAPDTGSQLPEPTAPFSSPAPASLSDRVINPISPQDESVQRPPDMSDLMNQELSGNENDQQQTPPPTTPNPGQ